MRGWLRGLMVVAFLAHTWLLLVIAGLLVGEAALLAAGRFLRRRRGVVRAEEPEPLSWWWTWG